MGIVIIGVDEVVNDFKKFVQFNAKATRMALNDKLQTAHNDAVRNTKKTWTGMSVADMKKLTKLDKARDTQLSVKFTLTSTPIPLFKFGATWDKSKKGASYKLLGRRKTLRGSFIAKNKKGQQQVYKKIKQGTRNVTPLHSYTPSTMFTTSKSEDVFINNFLREFGKRYLHHIDRLTK